MVNGQEYQWAGLFARIDQFISLHQKIAVDTLVSNQRTREALEALPDRIANAISVRQTSAAPVADASRLSDLIVLVKAAAKLVNWSVPLTLLLLLAAGLLPADQLALLPSVLLR